MVLGGRVVNLLLVLMKGISALIKEVPETSLQHVSTQQESAIYKPKCASHQKTYLLVH
jgi:hypothetical protein